MPHHSELTNEIRGGGCGEIASMLGTLILGQYGAEKVAGWRLVPCPNLCCPVVDVSRKVRPLLSCRARGEILAGKNGFGTYI